MSSIKYIIPILIFSFLYSCNKAPDSYVHARQSTYKGLVDSLKLTCDHLKSEYWFKGKINEDSICYFDDFDGKISLLTEGTQVITTKPELVVGTDSPNKAHRLVRFGIRDKLSRVFKEELVFKSPLFDTSTTAEEIVDSMFFKQEWDIRSSADSTNNIGVDLRLLYPGEGNGFQLFFIASHFGGQRNSYIRFKSVKKTESISNFIYDVEMEVICNLYLDPLYDIGNFYGTLEGEMKARFEVRKQ